MKRLPWNSTVVALPLVVAASACVGVSDPQPELSEREVWRIEFERAATAAANPTNNASPAVPFGRPHPDMPAAFAQFAFLVGEHQCTTQAPRGVNPFDKDDVPIVPFQWSGEYIMDGRAIRDEWADINSTGMQTRIYDPDTERWSVRWVGMGVLEGFGLLETQGDFSAAMRTDGTIDGVIAEREYEGALYRSVITFSDITEAGFEWRLETTKDGAPLPFVQRISCRRTRG